MEVLSELILIVGLAHIKVGLYFIYNQIAPQTTEL